MIPQHVVLSRQTFLCASGGLTRALTTHSERIFAQFSPLFKRKFLRESCPDRCEEPRPGSARRSSSRSSRGKRNRRNTRALTCRLWPWPLETSCSPQAPRHTNGRLPGAHAQPAGPGAAGSAARDERITGTPEKCLTGRGRGCKKGATIR